MLLLAVPVGLLIGLVVGPVGGGGAILALPVLVYVLGEGVGPATTASLIVVALAAAIGAGALAHDRQVCWRIALTFAAPAATGSLLGTLGSHAVDARVLILAFAPVMLIAAADDLATSQRRPHRRRRGLPAHGARAHDLRRPRSRRAHGLSSASAAGLSSFRC